MDGRVKRFSPAGPCRKSAGNSCGRVYALRSELGALASRGVDGVSSRNQRSSFDTDVVVSRGDLHRDPVFTFSSTRIRLLRQREVLELSSALSLTPKVFASVSPGFKRTRTLGEHEYNLELTLKALGTCDANPFQGSTENF